MVVQFEGTGMICFNAKIFTEDTNVIAEPELPITITIPEANAVPDIVSDTTSEPDRSKPPTEPPASGTEGVNWS